MADLEEDSETSFVNEENTVITTDIMNYNNQDGAKLPKKQLTLDIDQIERDYNNIKFQ